MIPRAKILFVIFALTIITPSASIYAQWESFSVGGYLKYLPSYSEYKNIDGNAWDNLLHFRLNTRLYATDNLTAALEFRFRAYYGESMEKIPYHKDYFFSSDYEFNQLSWYLWEKENSLGYLQMDRVWVEYMKDNIQLTVGRQRIAWGTALVWNITDIFNPLNILDFDYEERPGTDAVRFRYFPSSLSSIDVVLKPAKTGKGTIGAVQLSFNRWEYDFNFALGRKNERFYGGFSFAGDISGAGFRGELTFTEAAHGQCGYAIPAQLYFINFPCNPYLNDNTPNWAGVLSADYTFRNSLYLHTEAIYNSNGRTKNLGILQFFSAEAGMLSPSRWEIFQEISYNITPLMRGSFFVIYNPNDNSRIWVPFLSYNALENLDLMIIGLLGEGDNLSEYGNSGKSLYARIKYSF